MLLIDFDIARELRKIYTGLPREGCDSIELLLMMCTRDKTRKREGEETDENDKK